MNEPRTTKVRRLAPKGGRLAALASVALCAAAVAAPSAAADPATFLGSSDDGSRVFFTTTQKLVPGDTDTRADVYERAAGTTRVLSQGPTGGNDAFAAQFARASDDGSRVFFATDEAMVAGDTDFSRDVYERSGGATTLISTGPTGGNGNFNADLVGSTPDGSVAFVVTNEQLVSADTDSSFDVYARSGSTTSLVSTGPTGGNGAFSAFFQSVSADGSTVLFTTDEQLVSADTDGSRDIYSRNGGTTALISTGSAGGNGAFDAIFSKASSDGSTVLFETAESLEAADTDSSQDVYERTGSTTTPLSIGPAGGNGAFAATLAGATADGSRVYIETSESLVAGDSDSSADVYERSGATVSRVSAGTAGGNGASPAFFRKVSADGTSVLFSTQESLEADDTDSSADVYKRSGGTTTTLISGMSGVGNGAFDAFFSGASSDTAKVFFGTREQLGGGDADSNIDYYQREGGTFTLISTGPLSGISADPTMTGLSSDGGRVFFETTERLTSDDLDTEVDVYERSGSTTTLVTIGNPAPVGPATPALTATNPASPSNVNTPLVQGQADAGTSIKIYGTADCSGAPMGTGSVAELQGAGIQVTVPSNSSTTLRATATNAQGDVSDCGTSTVGYTEDSSPPSEPVLSGTSPASPANDNSPKVQGSADSGTTVALFDDASCSNPPIATGTAAALAAAGITVTVPDDSVTTFHATSSDAAGNTSSCSSSSVTYQEVSSAPVAPTLTAVTPASPANQNNPSVTGSAPSGATVQLFTTSNCSGAATATGTDAQLGGAGIQVSVPDNSTTAFHATASVAGNTSPCSSTSVTYVEDSAAPGPPTIDSTPGSPANDNSPRLTGSAEGGAQVKLFDNASCGGSPVATGSAGDLASGMVVAVPDDSTTSFAAIAVDAAGNASGCSAEAVYVEDSTNPNTRITFAPGVVTRDRTPVFRFTDDTENRGTEFLCKIDKRRFGSCKAPKRFKKLRRGRHKFKVKAIDAAGNQEQGPARFRFRIARSK